MDFGMDDILVLKATYEGRTRRLTMRKSPVLTVAALEASLLDLFNIQRPPIVTATSPGSTQGVPKSSSLTGVAGSSAAFGAGVPAGGLRGMMTPDEMLRSALGGGGDKNGAASSTSLTTLEITYKDVEGDVVSLVDDRDVRDALFFQKLNPLRLNISLPSPSTAREAQAPEETSVIANGKGKDEEEVEEEREEEEESVRVHFRAEGVELRESSLATKITLDRTVSKVCDLVSEAIRARSSLLLEVQFDGSAPIGGVPGADTGGVNGHGHAGEGEHASLLGASALSGSQQHQPQVQQQQQQTMKSRGGVAAVPSPFANSLPVPRAMGTPTSRGVGTPTSDQHADLSMLMDTTSLTLGGVPAPLALPPHMRPFPQSGSNGGSVHTSCAVCKMSPIHGPRYQSILKSDYELCYTCYSAHGADGNFQKISSDLPAAVLAKARAAAASAVASGRGYGSSEGHGSGRGYASDGPGGLGPLDVTNAVDAINSNGTIHEGIECDLCRMCPIVGPRYKSNVLQDFDLCQECYLGESDKHLYDEVMSPLEPSPRRQ